MRDGKRITEEVLEELPMGTIDEFVPLYEERGAWTDEMIETHVLNHKKAEIRKQMQLMVNELGQRIVHSFKVSVGDEKREYYIQEHLFDPSHYKRLGWRKRAIIKRECTELIEVSDRLSERFGEEIEIPEEVRTLAREL